MGRVAGKTLIIVCDLAGTNPESRRFASEFASFAEIAAGETISAAEFQWETVPSTGVPQTIATTAGAPVSAYGITVGVPFVVGTQVQCQITASPQSNGVAYAVCCSAQLSTTPDDLVVRGRLNGQAST